MGNKTLIYKQKVKNNLKEGYKYLSRLNTAFKSILESNQELAYSDQIIYRFSR